MSAWSDPRRWRDLCAGVECPICTRGRPLDIIEEFESAWLTAQERAPMRGYACLVAKTHAVELHDLAPATAAAFMEHAQRVSRALSAVTGAAKLNYEIHGNTLPHLHMHFYPRYPADRFEGRPIDPKAVTEPVYADGEFEQFRAALLKRLRGEQDRQETP
jgi:diadenosine tetraphosphate (Ap4A) HIT family hydrolase